MLVNDYLWKIYIFHVQHLGLLYKIQSQIAAYTVIFWDINFVDCVVSSQNVEYYGSDSQ